MNEEIKSIYLHKLKFNVSLVLEQGIVKFFMKNIGMWLVICQLEWENKNEGTQEE